MLHHTDNETETKAVSIHSLPGVVPGLEGQAVTQAPHLLQSMLSLGGEEIADQEGK